MKFGPKCQNLVQNLVFSSKKMLQNQFFFTRNSKKSYKVVAPSAAVAALSPATIPEDPTSARVQEKFNIFSKND